MSKDGQVGPAMMSLRDMSVLTWDSRRSIRASIGKPIGSDEFVEGSEQFQWRKTEKGSAKIKGRQLWKIADVQLDGG